MSRLHKNDAINPTEANVPKMDRPSIAFAWFLDSMVIQAGDPERLIDDDRLVRACSLCGESVCEIEATDNLRVLLNTALAHTC